MVPLPPIPPLWVLRGDVVLLPNAEQRRRRLVRVGCLVIGIAGGTGSGKTTLSQRLVQELADDVTIIEHDWYYRDRSGVLPTGVFSELHTRCGGSYTNDRVIVVNPAAGQGASPARAW